MSDTHLLPEDCQSMADVRTGVDATDAALVALLVRRFGYMRAAARIKQSRDQVRDEARKAEVVEAVRQAARDAGLPEDALATLWGDLVETSISYELEEWDRLRT